VSDDVIIPRLSLYYDIVEGQSRRRVGHARQWAVGNNMGRQAARNVAVIVRSHAIVWVGLFFDHKKFSAF
jgi:hypothetical protein